MTMNIYAPGKGELLSDPEHFNRESYLKILKTCCGHVNDSFDVRLIDELHAFGQKRLIKLPSKNNKRFEFCHRCLEKMSCLCPITGNAIFIGDAVTAKFIQDKEKDLQEFFSQKNARAYPFTNPNFLPEFAELIKEAEEEDEVIFEVVTAPDEKQNDTWYNQGFYAAPGIFVPETRILYHGLPAYDIRQNFLKLENLK